MVGSLLDLLQKSTRVALGSTAFCAQQAARAGSEFALVTVFSMMVPKGLKVRRTYPVFALAVELGWRVLVWV